MTVNRWAVLAAACAIAANTPLFFNNGTFWDGWAYDATWRYRDFDGIYQSLSSAGRPGWAVIYFALGVIDPIWGFKLATATGLTASAFLATILLVRFGLPSAASGAIASLASIWPANAAMVSQTPSIYPLLLASVLAAAALMLPKSASDNPSFMRITIAVLIAAIGATFEALIPVIFLIPVISALHARDPRRILRLWPFYALGLVAAVLAFKVFAPIGDYAGERTVGGLASTLRIVLDWTEIIAFTAEFQLPELTPAAPILAISLLATAFTYAVVKKRMYHVQTEAAAATWLKLLLVACAAYMLLSLPFAIGGRVPNSGWSYRHVLLLGLPVAMMAAAWIGLLAVAFNSRAVTAWICAGCMALGILQLLNLWTNYALWQSRWARDVAILRALASDPVARDARVLWIDDEFPRVLGERTRFYEWLGMADRALGRAPRLPFAASYLDGEGRDPAVRDALVSQIAESVGNRTSQVIGFWGRGVTPTQCQIRITIRAGAYNRPPGVRMALAYLTRAVTSSSQEFDAWIKLVAEVEIKPVANCPA